LPLLAPVLRLLSPAPAPPLTAPHLPLRPIRSDALGLARVPLPAPVCRMGLLAPGPAALPWVTGIVAPRPLLSWPARAVEEVGDANPELRQRTPKTALDGGLARFDAGSAASFLDFVKRWVTKRRAPQRWPNEDRSRSPRHGAAARLPLGGEHRLARTRRTATAPRVSVALRGQERRRPLTQPRDD
jgi:hypothetical protein